MDHGFYFYDIHNANRLLLKASFQNYLLRTFFIFAGYGLVESGMCHRKNEVSILLMNAVGKNMYVCNTF